jgi:hypothetical protein
MPVLMEGVADSVASAGVEACDPLRIGDSAWIAGAAARQPGESGGAAARYRNARTPEARTGGGAGSR